MKNHLIRYFFLILLATAWGCTGNTDTSEPDDVPQYAGLTDVTLKQTINGKTSFELTEIDAELVFSSRLQFNDKAIDWAKPTLEQSFDDIFTLSAGNVSVTNAQGTAVAQAEVSIDGNTVKVALAKSGGSYDYLISSEIVVDIKTSVKPDFTEAELEQLNYSGFSGQSLFWIETQAKNIKSNSVFIVSKINPDAFYDVKGDPNNSLYAYKLNVVYFVATDMPTHAGFKKRISTILLKHQLFMLKWMKFWGYAEKSFGLPLDENGMVDIVVINAKGPKANYPYSGGGSTMMTEINDYYANHGLQKYSDHTLVISSVGESTDETPFYGMGRWCFALDYAGMSFESMSIDPITGEQMNPYTSATHKATVWIGGMLHELGHGLNKPHVGPAYSDKNSADYGITLMGAGNRTYGESPTFMSKSSAAIINNCQLSSFTNKTFYEATTASLNIAGVEINGGTCTVKGNFTASLPVTDIIVRFFNSTETFLGGSSGYTSVSFVTKPEGGSFQTEIPIEELRVNTFDYKVGVTLLMENGTTKSMSQPYIYRLVNNGGTYTLECDDIINDGSWNVTVSHALPKDNDISNAPGSLVDGDLSTCLSMVKPGKSYDVVSVPAGDVVYAVVDFGKELTFSAIVLTNRNFQLYLNAQEVSFYQSDDGISFTPLKTGVELPEPTLNEIALDEPVTLRYLKMTFDKWDDSQGNTMQFAELGLRK